MSCCTTHAAWQCTGLDCTNGLKSDDRTPDGYQAEQFIWGQSHVHLVLIGLNPTCFSMKPNQSNCLTFDQLFLLHAHIFCLTVEIDFLSQQMGQVREDICLKKSFERALPVRGEGDRTVPRFVVFVFTKLGMCAVFGLLIPSTCRAQKGHV